MTTGRHRYTLTRPCLDTGTLSILRYLELILPLSGEAVFVGDVGEEIRVNVNTKEKRLEGLREYYARHRLGVNDALYITPIADRRYQLEAVPRGQSTREETRETPQARGNASAPKPKPQRLVGEETAFVREVREVRVSPYPKGLIYPQDGDGHKPDAAKTEATTPEAATPAITTPEQTQNEPQVVLVAPSKDTPEARANVGGTNPTPLGNTSLSNTTKNQASDPTTNNAAEAQALRISFARGKTPDKNTEKNTQKNADTSPEKNTATPKPEGSAQPDPTAATDPVQHCFETLGYTVTAHGGDRYVLQAPLGKTRSHRIALLVLAQAPSAEQWRALGDLGRDCKYTGVLGRERLLAKLDTPAGMRLSRINADTLERLRDLTKLAPLGPLDLEGYWNAGWLDNEALQSLEATARERVEARGVFSSVLLALGNLQAPTVFGMEELAPHLDGYGFGRDLIVRVLDSLCEAPFLTLGKLGPDEYHLRQPLGVVLTQFVGYATSLKQHLG